MCLYVQINYKRTCLIFFYRGLEGKKSIPVSYILQTVGIGMNSVSFYVQGQNSLVNNLQYNFNVSTVFIKLQMCHSIIKFFPKEKLFL